MVTRSDNGSVHKTTTGMLSDLKTTSPLTDPGSETATTYHPELPDIGGIRPWRIALLVKHAAVELIVSVTSNITVGRTDPRSDVTPNIDLRPFGAEQFGVSRRHMVVKLEGEGVVIEDMHSVNGTRLNGSRLEPGRGYPVRHGDQIVMGGMELQIQMLLNPLE